MEKVLKIMTFNLRIDTEADGKNRFEFRKEGIVRAIKESAPDVIGFQEATVKMRSWLRERLSDYIFIGCGRDSEYSGEGTPVAFKSSLFELISLDTKWLSPTPDIPGSTYGGDQSKCPRSYLDLRLKIIGINKILRFINTHADHRGETARVLEVSQIIDFLEKEENEIITITGDFNAQPDSKEIKLVTSKKPELALCDATYEIESTIHWYGTGKPIKIDYIFTNAKFSDAKIIKDETGETPFLSDHDPVVVNICI